ncbi:hypothetical protein [Arachidicoccus sp.]|uniref:hypothetical protein n=1 Tax=Arachidicoccus sp. TaxID=1872624 RepID=UPI003D1EF754
MPFKGYHPRLKSKKYNKKHSRWLFSYSFYSIKNGSTYVIEAFYYVKVELFIIKFYDKNHSGKNKYAILTNKGDVRNILMTNFNLLNILLEEYPTASFCFMGERRYFKDKNKQVLVEDAENNIRYRVYKSFIEQDIFRPFLNKNFLLKYKNKISSYLFLNKSNILFPSLLAYEEHIRNILSNEFPEIRFLG